MKIKSTKPTIVLMFSFFTVTHSLLAQNWQLGGNNNPPMNTTNNFLGSSGTNNIPIKLGTAGINRMIIDNGGTGVTAGRIAIGNNLPSRVFMCITPGQALIASRCAAFVMLR